MHVPDSCHRAPRAIAERLRWRAGQGSKQIRREAARLADRELGGWRRLFSVACVGYLRTVADRPDSWRPADGQVGVDDDPSTRTRYVKRFDQRIWSRADSANYRGRLQAASIGKCYRCMSVLVR